MSTKYTSERDREVLRLCEEFGPAEASRRTGIPRGSIWMMVDRAKKAAANQPPALPPAAGKRPTMGPVEAASPPPAPVAAVTPTPPPSPTPPRRQVAHIYSPSQRAAALELVAKVGVTAASKELHISRFSLNEWRRLMEKASKGQAADPTSGPDPKAIEVQRDREILEAWKEHPGLGPAQIRNQLRRKGVKVSVHTTRNVMQDAGYRPPKVHRVPHDRRFEAIRPNHMWHLDFVQRYIHKNSTFNLFLLDDHSRFVTGFAVDDAEHADTVIRTFTDATTRHGRPEMVLHDKGSAFCSWKGISRFWELLTEMGIEPIAVEQKETNGKVEVFNANLHKEFFDVRTFYDVSEMRRSLASHVDFYNHRRTHTALGGLLVPADRFFGRADHVLARIEAGGVIDPKDPYDLVGRAFDLLRVTSNAGKPEVWLMGTKIMG